MSPKKRLLFSQVHQGLYKPVLLKLSRKKQDYSKQPTSLQVSSKQSWARQAHNHLSQQHWTQSLWESEWRSASSLFQRFWSDFLASFDKFWLANFIRQGKHLYNISLGFVEEQSVWGSHVSGSSVRLGRPLGWSHVSGIIVIGLGSLYLNCVSIVQFRNCLCSQSVLILAALPQVCFLLTLWSGGG